MWRLENRKSIATTYQHWAHNLSVTWEEYVERMISSKTQQTPAPLHQHATEELKLLIAGNYTSLKHFNTSSRNLLPCQSNVYFEWARKGGWQKRKHRYEAKEKSSPLLRYSDRLLDHRKGNNESTIDCRFRIHLEP